jgi:hypothetical protein
MSVLPTRLHALRHPAAAAPLALALLAGLALSLATAGSAAAAPPLCVASQLSARITFWQGAAGSRAANVLLVNTSFASCQVRNYPRVQLVSASGAVLINGTAASTTGALHTLAPLGFLKTEVIDSNYCGPAYAKPVTVAFWLPDGLGRIVAIPLSPADAKGVPPCFGAPGSPGHISVHAWHT